MYWLRRAFAGAALAWPAALLLTPAAATRLPPSSLGYGFALVMYAAGSLICHQRPERSFHLFGAQLPVCARCTGIYAGAALTAALLPLRRRAMAAALDESPAPRTILLLSALPVAATLLIEWTTGYASANWMRAVSGFPLGAAVAWIVSGVG